MSNDEFEKKKPTFNKRLPCWKATMKKKLSKISNRKTIYNPNNADQTWYKNERK